LQIKAKTKSQHLKLREVINTVLLAEQKEKGELIPKWNSVHLFYDLLI
jgi:hypothetical protein